MAGLRVLELYSGMGGMHCGLTASGASAEVVAAVDVNTIANEVYKYNFPDTPLWPKTIEGIPLKELDSLSFDMILMSPPCQPFTRIGLHGDVSDPRAKSFLYVLEILTRLQKTPKYILLENVKGFESSEARRALITTLQSCSYHFQEFLLSPTCLGIPNSRLRYFMIAKLQSEPFAFQTTNKVALSSDLLCWQLDVDDADKPPVLLWSRDLQSYPLFSQWAGPAGCWAAVLLDEYHHGW